MFLFSNEEEGKKENIPVCLLSVFSYLLDLKSFHWIHRLLYKAEPIEKQATLPALFHVPSELTYNTHWSDRSQRHCTNYSAAPSGWGQPPFGLPCFSSWSLWKNYLKENSFLHSLWLLSGRASGDDSFWTSKKNPKRVRKYLSSQVQHSKNVFQFDKHGWKELWTAALLSSGAAKHRSDQRDMQRRAKQRTLTSHLPQ